MSSQSIVRQRNLALVIVLGILLLYIVPTQVRPANFMQDDSYFYMQVASNIVEGYGSTFHRVTPTNGYHPLWLVFSVLSMAVAGGNKDLALHVAFFVQTLLSLGTMYFIYLIGKQVSLKYGFVWLAVIAAFLLGTGVYGSEAHINAVTLSASIHAILLAMSSNQYRNWIASGLLIGLAILARLDNIFVAMTLIGAGAWMTARNFNLLTAVKRLVVLGLVTAVVVLPYVVHNQVQYGHIVPISGSIKSIFPKIVADPGNLGRVGSLTTIFGLAAVVTALVPSIKNLRRALLFGLGSGVLLHAGYVVLFTDHYTFWPWYYVAGVITSGLVVSHFFEVVAGAAKGVLEQKTLRLLTISAGALLVVMGGVRAWIKSEIFSTMPEILAVNEYRWPDELAIWMRHNLPGDSLIFVNDWPGAIAYYSDLRILPMDGLMNDFQYNDELLVMGINGYLCGQQAKYYLGPLEYGAAGNQELEVASPLYRQPVGKLVLGHEDIVVKVREVVAHPEETPSFAIWDISGSCSDT